LNKLLQSVARVITKCGSFPVLQSVARRLLQNVQGITKCGRIYYKVLQVLQSVAQH